MQFKMIVSDFDGTITNLKGEVTKNTIDYINKYQDNGGIFVVATGRTRISVIEALNRSEIKYTYLISYCGALITDEINNKTIYENYLQQEDIKKIIEVINKTNMACLVFGKNMYYSIGNQSYVDRYINQSVKHLVMEVKGVDDLKSMISLDKISKMTILNYDSPPLAILNKKIDLKGIQYYKMQNYALEIVDKDSDKSKAMDILLRKLNIKEEDASCIGDSENDYHLIKNHTNGFAVENASDNIKDIAKRVFKHCNDEPIVELISYKKE